MADKTQSLCVSRIKESGGRDATVLESDCIRVMIDDLGGMVPELSYKQGKARVNAHWLPWFRSNSLKPYSDADAEFWTGNLLYHVAGNFPCTPNFGGDNDCDGLELPPHGWAANLPWCFSSKGLNDKAAWVVSDMDSPEPKMPLSFKKIDMIIKGHAVHYTSLLIINRGSADIEVCAAWHNTVGAPFLQSGCIISGAAKRWLTAPAGAGFDSTSRLALDAEFSSLKAAPLAAGGSADISLVPGPIGYTDFVCGAIPESASLGWSALVNPLLKAAYVCFFTGAAAAAEDDIILRFNNLWMQYGGRRYTPWAACDGGTDLTYCLGTENSIAAYASGLRYAREKKQLLGAPTTVCIPAGKTRTLRYGTLCTPYDSSVLDSGVVSVEIGKGSLLLIGKNGSTQFSADTGFGILKELEEMVV